METNGMTPAIGRLGLYSGKLVEILSATTKQVVTDEELSKVIDMDTRPGQRGYSYLQSACKHTLDACGRHWQRIPKGNCLKLTSTDERHSAAEAKRKSTHRTARKALKILHSIPLANLATDEQRKRQLVNEVQLGLITQSSSTGMRAKLENRELVATTIDPSKLLEALVKT